MPTYHDPEEIRRDPAAAANKAMDSMKRTQANIDAQKGNMIKHLVKARITSRGVTRVGGHKPHQEHTVILAAFRTFDNDKVGFITYDQFKTAMGPRGLNLGLNGKDMNHLIKICDEDGNGAISYDEFLHAMAAVDRNLGEGVMIEGRERNYQAMTDRVAMSFPEFPVLIDPAVSPCASFRSTARPDTDDRHSAMGGGVGSARSGGGAGADGAPPSSPVGAASASGDFDNTQEADLGGVAASSNDRVGGGGSGDDLGRVPEVNPTVKPNKTLTSQIDQFQHPGPANLPGSKFPHREFTSSPGRTPH